MNKFKLLTFLILTFLCSSVFAKRLYKIELVIFSQNMPNSESFYQTRSRVNWPKRLVDLSEYKQVRSKHMSLHGSVSALTGSPNYRTLLHVSWIQGVKGNSLSKAVKIRNGEGSINGFFRLQRGNLVHMVADIEYSPSSVVYRISEKRRFKLNETHYFDHPKFGILARVSPIGK